MCHSDIQCTLLGHMRLWRRVVRRRPGAATGQHPSISMWRHPPSLARWHPVKETQKYKKLDKSYDSWCQDEFYAYDIWDLTSGLGGLMGLFIGWSFLSILFLVYGLLENMLMLCCDRQQRWSSIYLFIYIYLFMYLYLQYILIYVL